VGLSAQAPGVHQTLLAAAGREFGTKTDDQLKSLVYIGLQFTR
jgi:hypothetical protein